MKHEDFDNEIGALFEEDSVLAQAVIDLQQRRKRISVEGDKIESESLTEEPANDKSANESNPDEESAASDTSVTVSDSYNFSATVESVEIDDADLSLLEAEALAVNPADVIPYTANGDFASDSKPKEKKKRLFGKSEKKSTEVIKLLDFVANENTVNTSVSEEKDADHLENASDANEATALSLDLSPADSSNLSEPDTSDTEADAILPAPDEETALPESAELNSIKDGDIGEDVMSDIEDITDSNTMIFDEGEAVFLTHFEDSDTEFESDNDSASEAEDTSANESDASDISNDENVDEIDEKGDNSTKSDAKKVEKSRFIDGVFDFVELFIFSLAAVLLITTFLFRHSVVEGSSMEQTLFDGEHIIISKLFYKPERGDIIVCEDYSTSLRKPIVKRIIAVPGDTVVFLNTGTSTSVFVNGVELDEDYVYLDGTDFTPSGAWRVGEDEVFVMGDHRNNSTDSRAIGTVKIDSIIGKALLRFYPFDTFGKIE